MSHPHSHWIVSCDWCMPLDTQFMHAKQTFLFRIESLDRTRRGPSSLASESSSGPVPGPVAHCRDNGDAGAAGPAWQRTAADRSQCLTQLRAFRSIEYRNDESAGFELTLSASEISFTPRGPVTSRAMRSPILVE